MPQEFMGCSRKCNGDGWDDHITVIMYNMGQYNECHYSQYLTIKEATKLRDQLTALIEKSTANRIVEQETTTCPFRKPMIGISNKLPVPGCWHNDVYKISGYASGCISCDTMISRCPNKNKGNPIIVAKEY